MRYAKYKREIIRLKELTERNPAAFNFRLAAWVAVGYLAVLLYFFCFAGILAALILTRHIPLRLIIVFGVVLFTIAKVVFQKPPPPEGLEATEEEFPELFEIVESAKRAVNGPDIYKVVLNMEYNAAVLQIPRISAFFGGYRNYLMVGLPLMGTLTPDEFESVLCHEFGHLSKNHSKFQQRINKVAMIWEIMDNLGFFLLLLFYPFVKFYSPLISCYIAVFQRNDEYEADRIAAGATSPETCAAALYKIHVYGAYFETKAMPGLLKDAAKNQTSFEGAVSRLMESLTIPFRSEKLDEFKKSVEKIVTGPADTHPSLMERLRALDIALPLDIDDGNAETALEKFAPEPRREEMFRRLETLWKEAVGPVWDAALASGRESRETIEKLEKKDKESWTEEEHIDYAASMEVFLDDVKTLELHRQVAERFPDSPIPALKYGSALLDAKKETGMAYIRKAMENPALAPMAAEIAVEYLHAQGREEEMEAIIEEMENRERDIAEAYEKRGTFSEKDDYEAPGLDDGMLKNLLDSIKDLEKRFKELYLVRKIDHALPGIPPPLLLAFKEKSSSFSISSDTLQEKLVEKLEDFPLEIYVLDLKSKKKLYKKLLEVPGSTLQWNRTTHG